MKRLLFCIALFSAGGLPAQVSLGDGLIAHYPFDGDLNDASGNNNHGKQSHILFVPDKDAKSKKACYFNGVNSFFELPNSNLYNFSPQSSFSISVWVSPDPGNTWPAQAVIVKSAATYDFTVSQWNYGIYVLNYRAMSGYAYTHLLNSHTELKSSTCWYHIVVTYNKGYWKMYINGRGESVSGKKPEYILKDSRARLALGKKGGSSGDWYKGKMDDVRIYNRILNQEEITMLAAGPCNPPDCSGRIPARFEYSISACNKVSFKLSAKKPKNLQRIYWDFGDGSSSEKTAPVHLFSRYGQFTVKAIVSSKPGCTDTFSRMVNIRPLKTGFSFSEQGQPGKLLFVTDHNSSLNSWNFGDGETLSNQSRVFHQFRESGDYNVSLVAADQAGCRDTAQKTIRVELPEKQLPEPIAGNRPGPFKPAGHTPLEKREKEILKTIAVEQDTVSISLYDNGIIDGDSITLLLDETVLLSHQLLQRYPLQIRLPISREKESHELTMYAENLGSIPPNTALLIIHDGEKRYEVYISSNKKSNGVVLFTRNP